MRSLQEEHDIAVSKQHRQAEENHALMKDNDVLRTQLKQSGTVIEAAETRIKQLKVQH